MHEFRSKPQRRSLSALLTVPFVTALLSVALLFSFSGPVCAVHTVRADDEILRIAADSGFAAVVQLLEWREVEPAPDELYWEYPDFLVRACQYYGLELILRLDHPPEWAILPGDSPPFDVHAYAEFARIVAGRYRGQVAAYIIWNEPNLAAEWISQPPDPDAYRSLVKLAADAVRLGDPGALVAAAGMAPTNQNDAVAANDVHFLEALYREADAFTVDVQAVHPYGFGHSPDSPLEVNDGLVFTRLDILRAVMANSGKEHVPFWATELGWTVGPANAGEEWQVVSPERQAEYLAKAFRLASERYPWLTLIAVWNLAPDLPQEDVMSGYSFVTQDGNPRPVLALLHEQPQMMLGRVKRQISLFMQSFRRPSEKVEILAPDVVIRLSDTDTPYPHWAKPYGNQAPSRVWQGTFYIHSNERRSWKLHFETMQVEERANRVTINGHDLLPPAIPVTGKSPFASVWTSVCLEVPPDVLHRGANRIEVYSSPRLPTQQDVRYESMQFRGMWLEVAD